MSEATSSSQSGPNVAPVDADAGAAEGETPAEEHMQVIGLQVDDEEFLVGILKIREIVRFSLAELTRVPHSHAHVLGVVNLRGKVVPVVDLGLRLSMESNCDRRRRMVVVESGAHLVGLTVDAVSEVIDLPVSNIESSKTDDDLTIGVVTFRDRVTALLDLQRTLNTDLAELGHG